jgi:excinuclease ABC subunit C
MDQRLLKIKTSEISKLPEDSGVYLFYGEKGEILYIGKANNIKERVKNHFKGLGFKDNFFIKKIKRIGFKKTGSEIESLLLEAKLIKKHQPKFNVLWKDDKNYFFAAITKEDFPKIFITHQKKNQKLKVETSYIGPFVDGKALKQTLKVLRRVFPYRTNCKPFQGKACLWSQMGLCPGACAIPKIQLKQTSSLKNKIKKESKKAAKAILKILEGKKSQLKGVLKKEMKKLASSKEYELAAGIRDQLTALNWVFENSKVLETFERTEFNNWKFVKKALKKLLNLKKEIKRIEGYDISNIQGKMATGSMVVFEKGKPQKKEYRKFKIKTAQKPNDTAMIKEILSRRFDHKEWPIPELILIDGGKGQLNAGIEVKKKKPELKNIKITALAKRKNELFIENKKSPVLLKSLPQEVNNLILHLRDESHRFAISYHRKLREKGMFG